MTHPQEPHPTSIFAGVLSYLLPGLGQMYQGRVAKGLLFFVCLTSLFHVGQAMGNWQNVYMPPEEVQNRAPGAIRNPLGSVIQRWHFAGQFWIGVAAWPAIWQFYEKPMPEAERFPFWNRYQRTPSDNEVNSYIVDSRNKEPDLGLMYTVIAGVLNILVIYDAYAGPAFPMPPKKPNPDDPQPEPAT